MDIISLVGNIESIFNPKVTFEGFFSINSHIISGASKYNKNTNLVEEYLYRKYYHHIYQNFYLFSTTIKIPIVFRSELNNGYGRSMTPIVDLFISNYISTLFYYDFKGIDEFDKEKICDENKRFLKEKNANINAILNGKMAIEDDRYILKAYKSMKEPTRKNLKIRNSGNISLKEKIDNEILIRNEENLMRHCISNLKDYSKQILLYYDRIAKDMAKPLNLGDLNDLVDYDILYLRLAKAFMNTVKDNLKTGKELPTLVLFLYKYYNALKELKSYSYEIDASDLLYDGEKKKKYSTKDFIREFESIVLPVKDPEIRYYQIMEKDNSTDYRDINNVNKKIEYLKDVENACVLAAEWDFVPKGQLLEPREKTSARSVRTSKKVDLKAREERLAEIQKRQQFLDNTPYTYKGCGKNKFDGYIAYMYENGFVIFEKFYENQKTELPAKSNATYVMNADNFVEMSKLTKPEIIDYIKAGNTDVMRKPHTISWEANILGIINSAFYTEEMAQKIERLITLGKIERAQELRKTYE